MRYRLLESLHAFSRSKLRESEEAASARDLHFEYFARLAARWGMWESQDEERAYVRAFALEIPNLRAALEWGFEREDPAPAFELLLKVALYWQQHCSIGEARAWLDRARRRAGDDASIVHAKLLRRASTFATIEDDYAAARDLTARARAMFEQLGDRSGTAEALHNLAVIEQRSGSEEEAYRLYGEALTMFEETRHEIGTITALYNLAQTAKRRGEFAEARAHLLRGMSLCNSPKHTDRLATFWTLRAELAMRDRDLDDAQQALERALEIKRALDDRHDQVEVLCNLSVLEIRRGAIDAALRYARDALALARQLNLPSLLVGCFELFAVLLDTASRPSQAREIFALSKAIRSELGYTYKIMSELGPDLAAFSDVPPAPAAGREAIERACAQLAADYL
jgi:tetratricopeptide (TPR) repeat protein